jgi:hypothetical protein
MATSRTLQGMFVCCCYLLPGGGRAARPVTAAALSSLSIINGGTQRRIIKFRIASSLRVGRRMTSTSSFDAAAAASSAYSSFDLSGKTALITGSSGGIGKAMASGIRRGRCRCYLALQYTKRGCWVYIPRNQSLSSWGGEADRRRRQKELVY